jgi:hypothetical protein
MEFITHLKKAVSEAIAASVASYAGDLRAESLEAMEQAARQVGQEVSGVILTHWLEGQEPRYAADRVVCPHCGGEAGYVRRRAGMVLTVAGRVRYRRGYYQCAACGHGHSPLDERLGIAPGEMSETVVKLAALVGVQEAFETSSEVLARLTLLELSPNSIRKACQQVGQAVAAQEADQVAHSQALGAQLAHKRAGGPARLYGSLDGFHAPFADGWHEVKTGVWWTVNAQGRAAQVDYYVDTAPAADFSELVWATGFAHAADQAQELIFVADGADWIWRIVDAHFPQAVQIVDWYHATTYLTPVAQLVCAAEGAQQAWLETVKTALWEGRLQEVIQACQALVRPHLSPEDDPAQRAVRYYTHHQHRLDYPSYRAHGYQIGSGCVESGCKQFGPGRLKLPGARWTTQGARLVAKARAAFLSGHWDHLKVA